MTSKELTTIIRKAVREELNLYFAEKFGNITSTNTSENIISNKHAQIKKTPIQQSYTNENINSLRSQMQEDIISLYNNRLNNDALNDAYEMLPNSLIGEQADIPIDKQSALSALQNTTQGQAVLNALTKDYSSMFKK